MDNPDEIETYDFIHIDGGHLEEVFSKDYCNSKKLINRYVLPVRSYNPDVR